MPRRFTDLAFTPDINELVPSSAGGAVVVLTGANNSGKSAYLKKMVTDPTRLYIGVNRFYSIHYLPSYQENDNERSQWFQNMSMNSNQEHQNFENSYYNAATGITGLTDAKRAVLMSTFQELFGLKIEVRPENPDNEFSNRYINVDGDSLSVTSSGTRLFLSLLAALMDSRFSTVAIDEPELGLSPPLQRRLSEILVKGQRKAALFPHNPNIIISTHSHLFLDKQIPTNNWVVEKSGNLISARRCSGFSELHDIQFRLLGNELGDLFLPDFAMFVEGETDRLYLEKILALILPKVKIAIQFCGGDLAARLTYWSSSLGDMQLSPYRNRTLIVYDRVKQAGIVRACDNAGLPPQSRVEWSENGIEFLYPLATLQGIYRQPVLSYADLRFDKDRVSVGDLSYTKMELCRMVIAQVNVQTVFPQEIEQKLLGPIRQVIG